MGGKGETVHYTRIFAKGPLSEHDKAVLKEKIGAIINGASDAITIDAMVKTVPGPVKKDGD
jgi:hypothetical protein